MAADLNVLRNAKAALNEDLIDEEDYAFIKRGFLKAQQIRAGVEAGFIPDQEYQEARYAFFQSLDMAQEGSLTPQQPRQRSQNLSNNKPQINSSLYKSDQNVPKGGQGRPSLQINPSTQSRGTRPSPPVPGNQGLGPINEDSNTPNSTPQSQTTPQAPPPRASVNIGHLAGQNVRQQFSGNQKKDVQIPVKVGDGIENYSFPQNYLNASRSVEGKMGMSGIGVHPDCMSVYNYNKSRKVLRWMIFKIDEQFGDKVVVDLCGEAQSYYQDFLYSLPEDSCRYAVYDYEYTNNDGNTLQKLLFFHWCPDNSTTRNRMMYASTKDSFRGLLDGVSMDMQASDFDEISEDFITTQFRQYVAKE